MRALLETEIDVDHVNHLGWTALLEAVILGDGGERHTEIVRMLLDAGADPAIADRDGVTALAHARERGYSEMVRLLSDAARSRAAGWRSGRPPPARRRAPSPTRCGHA